MDESRADLMMRVEGMTCDGCAAAVARTIRRIDPQAEVAVDRPGGRVTVRTDAQAPAITEALTRAGYTASAMTG